MGDLAFNISEENLFIFEHLSIFALLDEQGKYVYVNKAWMEARGCKAEKVLGRSVTELFPDTRAMDAMREKRPILAHTVKFGSKTQDKQFTSYFPLIRNDEVVGCAILTFFKDMDEALRFSNEFSKMQQELNYYRQTLRKLRGSKYSIDDIIGESAAVKKLKRQIHQAARSVSNVLIEGETGTGKELVSHSIHDLSTRSSNLMIKLNCAAIPLELAESELFGYDSGAFTGAKSGGKMGKFELANHGTLFLDEIEQLSAAIQPKLLRVLQEKEIERVGGGKSVPIDVRLIAATNKPLEDLIAKGRFREDLYYRLNVINIRIPPLRERAEDIPLLAAQLIDRLNIQLGTTVDGIDQEVLSRFEGYDWPGNIRELQNLLERAINSRLTGCLTWDDFADYFETRVEQGKALPWAANYRSGVTVKKQIEKKAIEEALEQFGGNKKRTAEYLGISRVSLYKKIQEFGIEV